MDWGRALAAIIISIIVNVQLVAAGLWPPLELQTELAQLSPPPPGSWIYDYFTQEQLDFILENWNSDKKWVIVDKKGGMWSVGQGEIPPLVAYAIQVYNSNLANAIVDYIAVLHNLEMRWTFGHGGYSVYPAWGAWLKPASSQVQYINIENPRGGLGSPFYSGYAKAYCGSWRRVGLQQTFGIVFITVYNNGLEIDAAYTWNGSHELCFPVDPGQGVLVRLRFWHNLNDIASLPNSVYNYNYIINKLTFIKYNSSTGKYDELSSSYELRSVTNNGNEVEFEFILYNNSTKRAPMILFRLGLVANIWYSHEAPSGGDIIYRIRIENPPPWEQNNTQPETCIVDRSPRGPPIALAGLIGGGGGQEAQWVIHENPFNPYWGVNNTDPDLDRYYHVSIGWAWSTLEPQNCSLILRSKIETLDLGEYSWDWNYLMGNVSVDAMLYDTQLPPQPGSYYFVWINVFDHNKTSRDIIVKYYNVTIGQGSGSDNPIVRALRNAFRPVVSAIKSALVGALNFAWDLLPREFQDLLVFLGSFLKDIIVGLVNAILQFPLVLEILKLLVVLFPAVVIAIMVYDPFMVIDLIRKLISLISQVIQAIRSALPLP
ncbi:MAG: hypothetical protein GSR84_03145 [Desulfurococcales archaeon]|nr:hypothetical protein [Desulfurococcales archaeon]